MQNFQNKALNSTSSHLFTDPPSVEMPTALFGTAYFRGASRNPDSLEHNFEENLPSK
jgi:hypothetical protein